MKLSIDKLIAHDPIMSSFVITALMRYISEVKTQPEILAQFKRTMITPELWAQKAEEADKFLLDYLK